MKIEEIRDIVRVVRSNEFMTDPPLDFRSLLLHKSKMGEFYKILLEPSMIRDEDVLSRLYQDGDPENKYKSLKSYFLSRALNNITFFELSRTGKSDFVKAIFKSYKYLFVVRVLLALGSRSGAIKLAKQTLKLAERYELHSVCLDLLGELMTDSLQLGKERDFMRYMKMATIHKGLLGNESTIVALQQQIRILFAKSLFISEVHRSEIRTALGEAKRILKHGDTYLGRISFYRLLYVCHQVEGLPLKSAASCDEAITYML
ncbi:MAG: hypothetical protein ACHQM6_05045, partial [Candidatus Kapaibacterium sp.]